MIGIIYKLTNAVTGKCYIGQTRSTIKSRFAQHSSRLTSQAPLHRAIKEFGSSAFQIEQIDCAETQKELDDKEKYWISKLNSLYPNGYNSQPGGRGFVMLRDQRKRPEVSERNRSLRGVRWTEERRQAHLQVVRRGKDHPCFGKPLSDETKQKISERAKGRIISDEHRKKVGAATAKRHAAKRELVLANGGPVKRKRPSQKGMKPRKQISAERRARFSESRRGSGNSFFGKSHSPETRKVISEKASARQQGSANPFFGRTHSEEAKEKIRQANLGKTASDETRKKMSESRKGRKVSDEARKNMAEAQRKIDRPWLLGRTLSEETRRRISESKRGLKKINGKMVRPDGRQAEV